MSAGSSVWFYASSFLYIHLVIGFAVNSGLAYVVTISMVKNINFLTADICRNPRLIDFCSKCGGEGEETGGDGFPDIGHQIASAINNIDMGRQRPQLDSNSLGLGNPMAATPKFLN